MELSLHIIPIVQLPPDLATGLLPTAQAEGFAALDRLGQDWQTGSNRFAAPGECLLAARWQKQLAGIGGLNVDPYDPSGQAGRVRRLYVAPEFRRQGIGRALVQTLIHRAIPRFTLLQTRTRDRAAGQFYCSLGFVPVADNEFVSHRLSLRQLPSSSASPS